MCVCVVECVHLFLFECTFDEVRKHVTGQHTVYLVPSSTVVGVLVYTNAVLDQVSYVRAIIQVCTRKLSLPNRWI